MERPESRLMRVAFFGHFDGSNFGNDCSLQAVLHHLRRFYPNARATCICTGPEATAATYHVESIPISGAFFRSWTPKGGMGRLLRRLTVGLISEPYQWLRAVLRMRGADMLIVPGTGLLTDAYGLLSWGPYSLFKWTMAAKLCRCRVAFVSVGAGPLDSRMGRFFVRAMLNSADFCSYRDESTAEFLRRVGVRVNGDQVYPDLAFSLPEDMIPSASDAAGRRPVVGLGVMEYPDRYSARGDAVAIHARYLDSLARFALWLLERGYDVRLLSGDQSDTPPRRALMAALQGRLAEAGPGRVIDEPVSSVADVLTQIAACDIVVATRFHNILLSFLCGKPVIAISFHHKCDSLMEAMGMSAYGLDIASVDIDELIAKFCDIERMAARLKPEIHERAGRFRERLEQQYTLVFGAMAPIVQSPASSGAEAEVGGFVGEVELRRSH